MATYLTTDIEDLCALFDREAGLTAKKLGSQTDITNRTSNHQIHQPLNVSTLAHYFGLQCDEFLRLSLSSPDKLSSSTISKDVLMKRRGISFESDIKQFHEQSILLYVKDEHDFLDYLQSSISSLTELRIAYNVKFRWTYDENLQSNYKPDFLLLKRLPTHDNRIEITVADAKSSLAMRIEHCVQVALYGIDLQVWLERNQLDGHVFINDIGEIWIPNNNRAIPYQTNTFPMRKLQERLKSFLKYDLKRVFTGSEWIMLPRCSLCSYSSYCRQRAVNHECESVNNLSYLNTSAHALIRTYFNSTLISSIDIEKIFDPSQNHRYHPDDIRKLQNILSIDAKSKRSAAIEAIQTHEPKMKQQTSLLIPKLNKDMILLFFFLLPNPYELHTVTLFGYNIYDASNQSWFLSTPVVQLYPSAYQVVSMCRTSLEFVEKIQRPCQLVLFEEQEKRALFEQLTMALDSEFIDQCLVLLSVSENAILLDNPPDVIHMDSFFCSHPLSHITKDKIEHELHERYHESSSDSNMKKVTKDESIKLLRSLNEKEQIKARLSLIGLPCLISLHTAIRQSFIIPVPGYFDLQDLTDAFKIPSTSLKFHELFDSLQKPEIKDHVQEHLRVLAQVYSIAQNQLSVSNRLQLDVNLLPKIAPIKCSHPHIRRLIFLRQYEMLYSLRSIQQTRFDLNESPVCIRIIDKTSIDQKHTTWKCQIERGQEVILKNFSENATSTNYFRSYQYLISEDVYSIRTFSDALFMDCVIDGVRSRTKLNHCGLAHVEQMDEEGFIYIRVNMCDFHLELNHLYYLCERYIDFNTKKAIRALERATTLTMQLIDDPRQLEKPEAIASASVTLQQQTADMFSRRHTSSTLDQLHTLNIAQQSAYEKVKYKRMTLIWGPPGTGKTYWSSVTAFQLLMLLSNPLKILITACTHAAIDNLLSSVSQLQKIFSATTQYPEWRRLAQELSVIKLDSNNYRRFSTLHEKRSLVVGSTVWTLEKLDSSVVFDIIFIDEATQLLTSDAVLALNRLAYHKESRLIIAGDPLQLPPIKRCNYPPLPHPVPDLFSSIFHCLLRDANNLAIPMHTEKPFEQISRCPYLSIFDENHRMNDQLSDFTRLLYGENYRHSRSIPLLSIRSMDSSDPSILDTLLQPLSSLYTVLIDSSSSSLSTRTDDLTLESHLVYSLLQELVSRISLSTIFIITPHRIQRAAIRYKLSKSSFSNVTIVCDTVERMQGQEAQCVILCMMYRQREMLQNELDFIYDRQRINVSITRAKQLCILLSSQLLINQPPLQVFADGNMRNAYTLLSSFVSKSSLRLLDNHGNKK